MLHTSCSDKHKTTRADRMDYIDLTVSLLHIIPLLLPCPSHWPLPCPSHLYSGVAAKVEVKLCWMGDAHVHCGTRRDVATLANLVLWWWEGLRFAVLDSNSPHAPHVNM